MLLFLISTSSTAIANTATSGMFYKVVIGVLIAGFAGLIGFIANIPKRVRDNEETIRDRPNEETVRVLIGEHIDGCVVGRDLNTMKSDLTNLTNKIDGMVPLNFKFNEIDNRVARNEKGIEALTNTVNNIDKNMIKLNTNLDKNNEKSDRQIELADAILELIRLIKPNNNES